VQDNLNQELAERDWGVQQVLTSANWGGVVGNFFTGGLNLQVEHHLFPAISFMHYPAIAAIVADECKKRGINVSAHGTISTHQLH
jgi:fatty acid desaturase (delta-4 desaturase)